MQWFTILAGVTGAWILWYLVCLCKNYLIASKTGFPIWVTPVDPSNLAWMIFSVSLRSLFERYLPTFAYERIRQAIYGWEFLSKYSVGQGKLGPAFLLVTPGRNELWNADPEITTTILARTKDFLQLDLVGVLLGTFGPNVITANGEDWKRQRKFVAPILNERISGLVWRESSTQADEMLDHFTKGVQSLAGKDPNNLQGVTDEAIQGVRTIAINVLGSVGYGSMQLWQPENRSQGRSLKLTYFEALAEITSKLVVSTFLPPRLLSLPFMPYAIQRIGAAVTQLPIRTEEMLEAERALVGQPRNNLMSALVRLSDDERNLAAKSNVGKAHYLTEDEIRGNLFQFTIAGYDTTANSLAYAITILAAEPQWQEWLIEEIDHVLEECNISDYERAFPKLKRSLAFMYEVLRLYTPVPHIARYTTSSQQVTTSTNTYHIPTNTVIYNSAANMQTRPDIWGDDVLSFRPTRWISHQEEKSSSTAVTEERLLSGPKGAFIPWSAGPRVCPGMKMAQVEFVAVMTTILRRYRVSAVIDEQKGESMEMARERLTSLMQDSQPQITLQMNNPRDVKLRWTRR